MSVALDPMVLLTAAAQRTKRLRLGTSVLALPLSINELSDGRLIPGLGAGIFLKDVPAEEVDMRKRGKITDERLDPLMRLLAGESVTHESEFHTFEDSRLICPVGRP